MGPTSISEDEAFVEESATLPTSKLTGSDVTDSPQYPLAPARPVGRTKPASSADAKKKEEAPGDGSDSPSADSAPAPARPKFRPPRTRARRPEPVPFDRLQPEPTSEADSGLTVDRGQSQLESDQDGLDKPTKRGSKKGRRKSDHRTARESKRFAGLSDAEGWKLATAVLTTLAVLVVGWGVYQTTKINQNQSQLQTSGATTAKRMLELENRLGAVETSTAAQVAGIQQQLNDFADATAADQETAKEQYAKVEQQIPVTATDFESAVAQVPTLSATYLTAKAAADSAPADQDAKLQSLEAKSALLTSCAKVWAGATQQIFNADNPQKAMAKVGKDLAAAAAGCKVVTQ